jgi:hypothetical protein
MLTEKGAIGMREAFGVRRSAFGERGADGYPPDRIIGRRSGGGRGGFRAVCSNPHPRPHSPCAGEGPGVRGGVVGGGAGAAPAGVGVRCGATAGGSTPRGHP